MTRTATALRLPAIAHVRRVARHDQVVPRPEEHVAAGDDEAAVLRGREIYIAAFAEPIPVGDDVAVRPKPRDTAVWVDAETQMGCSRGFGDREQVVRVAFERPARQNLDPVRPVALVDRARLRIVPLEMRRLDVDAANDAAHTEADDAPVVNVGRQIAAAARLPAVHPLAAV